MGSSGVDLLVLLKALILGVVEGLTEFLPVSSTAHMIFTSSFFGIQEDAFVKMFMVSIDLTSLQSQSQFCLRLTNLLTQK